MSYLTYIQSRGLGRKSEEIALDLINYFNNVEIPLDVVTFFDTQKLDYRPDILEDPDTFLVMEFDENYTTNYPGANGFVYRKLDIALLINGRTISIMPPGPKYGVHDVLGQINFQLNSKLSEQDLINTVYEASQTDIELKVSHRSLAWYGMEPVPVDQDVRLVYVRITQDGALRSTPSGFTRSL